MTETKPVTIEELRQVLERFGADNGRWPVARRGALEAFFRSNKGAKDLYDEFAAFDQLLVAHADAMTSGDGVQHDRLKSQILEAVTTAPESHSSSDNVVSFDRPKTRKAGHRRAFTTWPDVASAGALAASLLLGISIGETGVANTALTPVSEALGLGRIQTETALVADPIFDVVDDGSFEEDVL